MLQRPPFLLVLDVDLLLCTDLGLGNYLLFLELL